MTTNFGDNVDDDDDDDDDEDGDDDKTMIISVDNDSYYSSNSNSINGSNGISTNQMKTYINCFDKTDIICCYL